MSKESKPKSELLLMRLRELHRPLSEIYGVLYKLRLESAYSIIENEGMLY